MQSDEEVLLPAPLSEQAASNPYVLGATPNDDGVDFVVNAPGASAVDLCLIDGEGADLHERRIGMHDHLTGSWSAHISGLGPGQRYGYRVYGPWNPNEGLRYNPRKFLLDPYAKALATKAVLDDSLYAHKVGVHGLPTSANWEISELDSLPYAAIGVVADPNYQPVAPSPRISADQRVIYETHVVGLTKQLEAIPEDLRGTYAGVAHPVMTEHLKNLGVTTIELLPIHAKFDEPWLTRRGLSNYWGYATLSYFAPEPTYATKAAQESGPQAVLNEVRDMVSALHEAGLEVVLDVVYNHTAEGGFDGPTLSLRGFDDLGYYLHDPVNKRQYLDVTGTGNTVDFRNRQAIRLTLDSLRYWVSEMGVDGFRFDLAVTLGRHAGEWRRDHPLLVAMTTDPVLCSKLLIAEPWDVGPGGWRTGEFPTPFLDWNDRYRGALREFWLSDPKEMSHGNSGHDARELATRIAGSADLFAWGDTVHGRTPLASVNFVTAHDGFTLHDLTTYNHKNNVANGEDNRDGTWDNRSWNHHDFDGEADQVPGAETVNMMRLRSARNLLGTLFISSGTPMLLGGDEFGRTQGGNNNAYCQDNEISWYDWNLKTWQKELIATTSYLIKLRQQHPALHRCQFATGQVAPGDKIPDLSWYDITGNLMRPEQWHDNYTRVLSMLRSGKPFGDSDALILINGTLNPHEIKLPAGRGDDYELAWYSVWDTPHADYALLDGDDDDDTDSVATSLAQPGSMIALSPLSMRIYLTKPKRQARYNGAHDAVDTAN